MKTFLIGWVLGSLVMWAYWEYTICRAVSADSDAHVSCLAITLRRRFLNAIKRQWPEKFE